MPDALGWELELAGLHPVIFQLSWQQVAAGDLDFFRGCVAGQFNDFQAIPQRRMHGIQPVGGGDEKDFAQVKGNFEVVIAEMLVLLRIQDFQQGRSRITAEIRTKLVDFVQQKHRIPCIQPFQGLQYSTRHGANVGSAVSPDLCFIPNATQRDARKRTAQ